MECVPLDLRIPAATLERLDCATWISGQPPDIVADAIWLCEVGINAVRQQLSEGESARVMKESIELRRRLDSAQARAAEDMTDVIYIKHKDLEVLHLKAPEQQQQAHAGDIAQIEHELKSRREKQTNDCCITQRETGIGRECIKYVSNNCMLTSMQSMLKNMSKCKETMQKVREYEREPK